MKRLGFSWSWSDLDANNWNDEGLRLASQGCYDEAIDCFDKALGFDPKNASIWNNKAAILNLFSTV